MRTIKASLAVLLAASLVASLVAAGPAGRTTTAPAGRITPAKRLLGEIPKVSLVKMPLSEALDHYAKLSGLSIRADWRALRSVGVFRSSLVTLKASEITFEKLLDLTLHRVAPGAKPLAWYLSGKTVYVSTQAWVLLRRGSPFAAAARTAPGTVARRAPRRRGVTEISFDEMPLKPVLDFFRDVSGVNFHVNWRSLEASGISQKTPVTLKASNISVGRALDLVLDQINVGRDQLGRVYWVVDKGVVEIATGEVLNRKLITRVYDVRDLLIVVPNFVAPSTATGTSGSGTGATGGTGRGLFEGMDVHASSSTDTSSGGESMAKKRQKNRDTLIEVIKTSIGEAMWGPTGRGSIKIIRGQLVITQTPLGFRLLEGTLSK
jgi:hypothetical protein